METTIISLYELVQYIYISLLMIHCILYDISINVQSKLQKGDFGQRFF